jgi:hypothetical protein
MAEPITPSPTTPIGSDIVVSLEGDGRDHAGVPIDSDDVVTGGKAHPANGGDPEGASRLEEVGGRAA